MKLGDGVEQAVHAVALLAGLAPDEVLPAAALARYHGLSPSFLLKHMQALSKAKIVATVPGPKGGYRLARAARDITLLDVVLAVEGAGPAFRCSEIRQRGPDPCPQETFQTPCAINAAMLDAERAYRAALKKTSLADIVAAVARDDTEGCVARRSGQFLIDNKRGPGGQPKGPTQ